MQEGDGVQAGSDDFVIHIGDEYRLVFRLAREIGVDVVVEGAGGGYAATYVSEEKMRELVLWFEQGA